MSLSPQLTSINWWNFLPSADAQLKQHGPDVSGNWKSTTTDHPLHTRLLEREEGWLFGTRYLEVHDDKSYEPPKASSDASATVVMVTVVGEDRSSHLQTQPAEHGGGYCEQSVRPESTAIWRWLTTLIRMWKTTTEHLPWVKYYHILSYLTLSTIKGGYYFSHFVAEKTASKSFRNFLKDSPPPHKGNSKTEFQTQVSLVLNPKLLAPSWFRNTWDFKKFQESKPVLKDLNHGSGVGPRHWYSLLMGSQDKEPLHAIMEMSFLSL